MPNPSLAPLLAQIRAVAARQPDTGQFLKELQAGIQEIPGAAVAFCARDAAWLDAGYLEERPTLTPEERQAALVSASARHVEGAASQDGISATMEMLLDECHPATEDADLAP